MQLSEKSMYQKRRHFLLHRLCYQYVSIMYSLESIWCYCEKECACKNLTRYSTVFTNLMYWPKYLFDIMKEEKSCMGNINKNYFVLWEHYAFRAIVCAIVVFCFSSCPTWFNVAHAPSLNNQVSHFILNIISPFIRYLTSLWCE